MIRFDDAAAPAARAPAAGGTVPEGEAAPARIAAAWRALAGVMDPEIPVLSLIDLGVIRDVREGPAPLQAPVADAAGRGAAPAPTAPRGVLEVTVTPTYSGCPATEVIEADVLAALEAAGLGPVRLQRRLAPAWSTDWISEAGRRRLREYGIAPPGAVAAPGPAGSGEAAAGGAARAVLHFLPRASTQPVACPRCDSADTERLSPFGATACKALYRCRACREPFEFFKPL